MSDEITPLIVKTAERVGLPPEKVREVFVVFEEEFDREEAELKNTPVFRPEFNAQMSLYAKDKNA